MKYKKKLIEVALPLEAINLASVREKSIRHGHPSTLHLWWARRPLAAARAVIFSQMVDDPSEHPDIFKTEKEQDKERIRLFKIIEELVVWENTNNEEVLKKARDEIWQSWRMTCAENADHPDAKNLFNRSILPGFLDPFAGGGALPLEAQRLGLDSYASDLNPVAVLINKAMIEIPPKFTGKLPVNPEFRNSKDLVGRVWFGAQGLAEDVKFYGQWIKEETEKRIGHLYPKIEVTAEMALNRPDLKDYVGKKLTVIAWLWTRTVKSPNPAFSNVHVPLASTFMLSLKKDKEAYVAPIIESDSYRFDIKIGLPEDLEKTNSGTKLARANFLCLMSGSPITGDYVKVESQAGRLGSRMMAIVAEGDHGRIYLPPTAGHEAIANDASPDWSPEVTISGSSQYIGVKAYGMTKFDDVFTNRQLVALSTFCDLINQTQELVYADAIASGMPDDGVKLNEGGMQARAYSEAIPVYLALTLDRLLQQFSTLSVWSNHPAHELVVNSFGRQAIAMTWDFGEINPYCEAASWNKVLFFLLKALNVLANFSVTSIPGHALQKDAQTQELGFGKVISTDPPYYDNVPYADLSDFFYVWLRRSLKTIFPDLFSTVSVPKVEELVAFAYRHKDGKVGAENHFLNGMTEAMQRLSEQAHPQFPITIFYAFKQAESDVSEGTASTGWETFLNAVIHAGFAITGTWPVRTEKPGRMRAQGSNALATSIVLVCRKKQPEAISITRRDFVAALKSELPKALKHLQAGNIAPVDLAQAAIGPGMAIFTRYLNVLDAEGKDLSIRSALTLINQTLDESLAEQEGDFDSDSRWALTWFEQNGFIEGDYGVAEQLSKSKNTSVAGLVEGGIISSKSGKVRLLKPNELNVNWDPTLDKRITAWEVVHQLIRALESGGEGAAALLVARLSADGEIARELCYRLYTLCERKKRNVDAMSYNGLVQSWPEILRLSRESSSVSQSGNQDLFDQE